MPNVVAPVVAAAKAIGAWYAGLSSIAQFAVKAAAFIALDVTVRKFAGKGDVQVNQDFSRDVTVRSAIESRKIIYGEALVSGPLVYQNTSGNDNEFLWYVIALAGHECYDITEIWVDDTQIGSGAVNWGSAVSSGKYATYATFWKQLGSSTQTTLSALSSAFASDFTAAHRGRGIAYITAKLELQEASSEGAFQGGAPRSIKGLVQGKLVYDPRKDPSSSSYEGSGAHDVTDSSTWEYSDNPALCAADYMIDSRLGMGMSYNKIDYDTVAAEANYCDGLSNTSSGTGKRFTCNGVLYTTDTHRDNLARILSSMNGRLSYSAGKFYIKAGRLGEGANKAANGTFDADSDWTKGTGATISGGKAQLNVAAVTALSQAVLTSGKYYSVSYQILDYSSGSIRAKCGSSGANGQLVSADGFYNELILATGSTFSFAAPTSFVGSIDNVEVHEVTGTEIDDSWLADDVRVKTAPSKKDRFNTFHGIIKDPNRRYKDSETLQVTQSAYVNRDGETLIKEVNLPMTNDEEMAQRILFKQLYQTDQQKVVILPCNYKPLQLKIHDFVVVTLSELNWSRKLFRVIDWNFKDLDDGGIDLVLKEDSSTAYAEPDQNDYSTRTAAGTVVLGDPGVPAPSNLTATNVNGRILVEWDLPSPSTSYDVIEVFASASSAWSGASLIYSGRGSFVMHEVDIGDQYYYWVRAKKDGETSLREPNSDTSATTATSGAWIDSGAINNGAVGTSQLDDDAVTTVKINDGAVTSSKVGSNAITSTKITDSAITTPKLAANSVTSAKVTTGELITLAAQIKNAIITGAKIGNAEIDTLQIAGNAVTVPSAYTSTGTTTISSTFTKYEVASLTVNYGSYAPDAALMVVTLQFNLGVSTPVVIDLLYEGSIVVTFQLTASTLHSITLSYLVESVGTGSRDFSVEVSRGGGVSFACNNKSLAVIGARR